MLRPSHRPLGWNASWKKVAQTCGEGPRAGQVWKKKPDKWPKVNKDPEELPYISDLTAPLLHSSSLGGTPTPFLCPASVLTNSFSVCSPTCCSAMSLIINFVPVFTVFASVRNAFSLGARARGCGVARIPGFHPGYPGSIPGQGIKISLHATTHCCLCEISKKIIWGIALNMKDSLTDTRL